MERGLGVFTISVLAVAIAISFVALYPYAVNSPSLSPSVEGGQLEARSAGAIGFGPATRNVCLNNICEFVRIPPGSMYRIGNECSSAGSSCGGAPQPTHLACVDFACAQVAGEGNNSCSTIGLECNTNLGCRDTDVNSQYPDGINPFQKGIIGGVGPLHADTCLSETLLQENRCTGNASYDSTTIDCSQYNAPACVGGPGPCFQKPMVCFNGACVANQTYRLDVVKTGSGADDGLVVGAQGIYCGNDCSENYINGTDILLRAHAGENNSLFISWTGCDGIAGDICHVTMNSDRQVTAEFEEALPDLIVEKEYNSSVEMISEGTYQFNISITTKNIGGGATTGYSETRLIFYYYPGSVPGDPLERWWSVPPLLHGQEYTYDVTTNTNNLPVKIIAIADYESQIDESNEYNNWSFSGCVKVEQLEHVSFVRDVKGFATGVDDYGNIHYNEPDVCVEENRMVLDWQCVVPDEGGSNQGSLSKKYYDCQGGCVDGACVGGDDGEDNHLEIPNYPA